MNPVLYDVVLATVLVVWVVNFGARLFVEGYAPAPQVDAIFMAIFGGAMALSRNSKGRNGNDDDA